MSEHTTAINLRCEGSSLFFSPAEATRGKDNSKSNDMHLAASRNATGGEETERVTPSLRVGSRRATGQRVDEQIAKTHKDMAIRPWTDNKKR